MTPAVDRPIGRVLVPLDGSERARGVIPAAVALARQAGSSLELLTVQTTGGDWERNLQALAADLPVPGVDTTLVSTGAPDEAITDLAEAVPGTVVCMATRWRSGLSEVLLGSVAARVVRRTRHPVMLIGPRAKLTVPTAAYTDLVICLSGSERAEGMLPLAQEWAQQLDIGVALVHGTRADAEPSQSAPTAQRLRELVAQDAPGVPPPTWHVASGPTPAAGVGMHLERGERPLAFVSLRQGARLERLLPGGFTAELVQQAPAPVVVVTAAAGRTA